MSQSPPNPLDQVLDQLSIWAGNFQRNTSSAFSKMTLKDYIRLVIVVGAYCLLRPYLIKLGAKLQERQHEKDSASSDTPLNANDLRRGRAAAGEKVRIALPGVDSDDEEDSDEEENAQKGVVDGGWGRNARLRQRRFVRQKLEEHEQRLREAKEEEEDKDIEEFLIKDD